MVADLSLANHNVLYELGLAYGTGPKIIVVHHEASEFGKRAAEQLNIADKALPYCSLDPASLKDWKLHESVWHCPPPRTLHTADNQNEIIFLQEDNDGDLPCPNNASVDTTSHLPRDAHPTNVSFTLYAYVESAVGRAMDGILNSDGTKGSRLDWDSPVDTHKDEISQLKSNFTRLPLNSKFSPLRDRLANAYCSIVRTGPSEGSCFGYFWLGYCHALGRNAVPISVKGSIRISQRI